MNWKEGLPDGCRIVPFRKFTDERGWLAEFFRHDELPPGLHPVMGYVSLTHPGVARGPHEHEDQTDLFVFFSGTFRLYLWDTRRAAATYGNRYTIDVGEHNPVTAIVPPGIVHAYRNVGPAGALVVNCPNRLYAGENKQHPVDEIRHEDLPGSPFQLD
jgi:dTDP-4-dehydrorhamnose 3,5-epimerase